MPEHSTAIATIAAQARGPGITAGQNHTVGPSSASAAPSMLPVAVASNSTSTILGVKLEEAGFAPHLSTWVSSEDVPRGKPAPDIYTEAVRRLGFAPGEALAVEDSVVGATSAVAAGLVVVAVPSVPDGDPVPAHHRAATLTDPVFRELMTRWLG